MDIDEEFKTMLRTMGNEGLLTVNGQPIEYRISSCPVNPDHQRKILIKLKAFEYIDYSLPTIDTIDPDTGIPDRIQDDNSDLVNIVIKEKLYQNAQYLLSGKLLDNVVSDSLIKLLSGDSGGKNILGQSVDANFSFRDVTIRFVNPDNVRIMIGDKVIKANYKDMGMQDGRTLWSNKQWQTLKDLAKEGGEIVWGSAKADWKVKKRKELLSKTLQIFFQLTEDPFEIYNRGVRDKSYKIKIRMIAEGASESEIPLLLLSDLSEEGFQEVTEWHSKLVKKALSG